MFRQPEEEDRTILLKDWWVGLKIAAGWIGVFVAGMLFGVGVVLLGRILG